MKNFSFLKSFPFEISAKLPGEGSLTLSGNAGPISQNRTTHSPFQATLQLRNFDPVASGVIDKSKGIKMQSDVDVKLEVRWNHRFEHRKDQGFRTSTFP